jgi:hypothetical protein
VRERGGYLGLLVANLFLFIFLKNDENTSKSANFHLFGVFWGKKKEKKKKP